MPIGGLCVGMLTSEHVHAHARTWTHKHMRACARACAHARTHNIRVLAYINPNAHAG